MISLSPPINPITPREYYTQTNQALTRSKVEDFLRDPHYFYLKHIERSLKEPPNDAMKVGSIVDSIFSGSPLPYQPKVLKRDDPELYSYQKDHPETVVPQSKYEEAVALGTFLIGQPFYQWYVHNNTDFQHLFQASYNGVDIAGLADAVTFIKKKSIIFIDDLKVTQYSNVKTPRTWWYKCRESGYFRQLGLYRRLAQFMYPEYKYVVCRHVVATTDMYGIQRVYFFELDSKDLERGADEFFDGVDQIMTCPNFDPREYSWDELCLLAP